MIVDTVPQYDLLLCMLGLDAAPGKKWVTVTQLVDAHYGKTYGTASQGRRQSVRNMIWRLYDNGFITARGTGQNVSFQLSPKAMRRLYPGT